MDIMLNRALELSDHRVREYIERLRAKLDERDARIKELSDMGSAVCSRNDELFLKNFDQMERITALEAGLREARHAFKCIGAVSGGLPSDMSITAIANIDKLLCPN